MGLSSLSKTAVWFGLLCFLYQCFHASAEHLLNFTSLNPTPVGDGAQLPQYTVGDNVTIKWTTPFKDTTLMVFQLKEHTFAYEVLAINYKDWETSYVWQVHPIKDTPLEGHPFHFVLENGHSYYCDGCVTRGPWFSVVEKSDAAGTKAKPATTSTTATSPPKTHKPQNPTAIGAAGAAHTQETKLHDNSQESRDIGLGVGLGLGIPLLLALLATLFIVLRRRKKRKQRFSYHPTGSGNWTTSQTVEDTPQMGESGALGTYATHSNSRDLQSRASQGSNPFLGSASRASYAPSRMSRMSHMSHKSWIDDFEFEKPEMRDQDAMSQLRRSIHSSDGTLRSGFGTPTNGRATPTAAAKATPSAPGASHLRDSWVAGPADPVPGSARRSEMSFPDTDLSSLEGMPAQPQAVHYRPGPGQSTGDGRDWPLP